jgi:hypothetical protein
VWIDTISVVIAIAYTPISLYTHSRPVLSRIETLIAIHRIATYTVSKLSTISGLCALLGAHGTRLVQTIVISLTYTVGLTGLAGYIPQFVTGFSRAPIELCTISIGIDTHLSGRIQ